MSNNTYTGYISVDRTRLDEWSSTFIRVGHLTMLL